MNKKGVLGNIVGAFIIILVGISLLPTITEEIGNACKGQMNVSPAGNTLLCSESGEARGLITLFFVLGMLVIGIGIMSNVFRELGIIRNYDDDEDYEDEEDEDDEDDEEDKELEDIITEDEVNEMVEVIEDKEELKEETEDRVIHKKW